MDQIISQSSESVLAENSLFHPAQAAKHTVRLQLDDTAVPSVFPPAKRILSKSCLLTVT